MNSLAALARLKKKEKEKGKEKSFPLL